MKNKNRPENWVSSCAAALRMMGFVGLTIIMVPIHLGYVFVHPDQPFHIPRMYYRILLRVLGMHIRVHGSMCTARPVMFVANHTSYLDIPALGAVIPAAFVAKADVAGWPLIGPLARLQGTLFVERNPSRAVEQRDYLGAHLAKGKSMILFPEGTSTIGLSVLPFKSSLFGIIEKIPEDRALTIQPISIACTELDGLPITRACRPFYAWYGDMTFFGHLWSVFKMGRFTVDIVFHAPVERSSFANRKDMAVYCQQQVAHGIEQCVIGREIKAAGVPQLPAPA